MMTCLREFQSSLPFRDFHFDVSARSCSIHSRYYPVHVPSQHRPLRIAEHHDRNCANRQILLVPDIFVGSQEHLKSSLFGGLQQFAVLQFLPPSLGGRLDCMSFEECADRDRSPLVKEDQHQRVSADEGVSSRLRAANSITALIWSRSKPSNQSIMSSMLAPASKFSNITETGMRVPRSTQAPLTFPATLSTAEHCDQSKAGILSLSFRSSYTAL